MRFPRDIAPKSNSTNSTSKGDKEAGRLKVLQISDVHYDPHYKVGNNADCDKPLCCQVSSGPSHSEAASAKTWGDYRNCDIPKVTFENMLSHIKTEHPDIDYIIWTGDIPPHDVWKQTKQGNMAIIKEVTKLLNQSFPKIPIFPCLGNHEMAPVDNFPPKDIVGDKYSISWLYNDLLEMWSTWLPYNEVQETIKWGGFYSHLVRPGFKLISLNMNFCNNLNWWLVFNTTDPSQQLQWLILELHHAENRGEKVHIIGHIPPGSENCIKYWSENFYSIVNRYENTIVAQFYGHTHFDEFEIFYDETNSSRAINIAYIGPSVTTFTNLNPGYKIYYIDGDHSDTTRAVLDCETWTMNLKLANQFGKPIWYKLYSAKNDFRLNSLHPEEWHKYVMRLRTNSAEFQNFYRIYYRDSVQMPYCDRRCKEEILCNLQSAKSYDKSRCY